MIGFLENIRSYFSITALINPKIIPMKTEKNPRIAKSPIIISGVSPLISLVALVYFKTVLNRIIETASFVIPSPNTILKSFGYAS